MKNLKEYILSKLSTDDFDKDYVSLLNNCKKNTEYSFDDIENAIGEMLAVDKIKRHYTDNSGKYELYINPMFEQERLKY